MNNDVNGFSLITDKTQFIWLGLGTNHFVDVLQINSIAANEVVNKLGVYFDPELLMERQVNKLCQAATFICDVWERFAGR